LKFSWQVLDHSKIKGKPRPWGFMGGAYVEADSAAMKSMEVLVYKIAQKRITSITGGGPGIMTASKESEKYDLPGISVVLNGLSSEQKPNDIELKINLSGFGTRQNLIMDIADVHIFYPGGMGTDFEIKETQTKTKTNKWNRPKLIILFDDVNSDPHWNLLHEQNLLYVKEGLLRFDSRNAKKHIFKQLGYSEVIENIINNSKLGSTLTENQILLIARTYNKDIKTIREILLETI
jgi:predicted Rossmann-fold nucleotide-binding protein